MSVLTITENGHQLTVQTLERQDILGGALWFGRAMFRTASGQARLDVVTFLGLPTREEAESAAVELAKKNGWGLS